MQRTILLGPCQEIQRIKGQGYFPTSVREQKVKGETKTGGGFGGKKKKKKKKGGTTFAIAICRAVALALARTRWAAARSRRACRPPAAARASSTPS